MATATIPTLKSSKQDEVATNGVIKEQVSMENKTSKEWIRKWGFMKDFDKFCTEAAAKLGITEKEYRQMAKGNHKRSLYEIGKFEQNCKPSRGVPLTSSGYVGWRAKIPNASLEICGPLYVSPRHTIDPPDQEILPITKIILG